MRKVILALTLIMLISVQWGFSQYDENRNAISVRRSFINYDYPISDELFREGDQYDDGFEIGYMRHLAKYLNLALPLKRWHSS